MIIKLQMHTQVKFSYLDYSSAQMLVCFQVEIFAYCFRLKGRSPTGLHFHNNSTLHILRCQ